MEKIADATIQKVASLARLRLSAQEAQEVAKKLEAILQSFASIAQIDTRGVEPLVTPIEINHPWRTDKIIEGLGAEKALEQAPERVGNSFKVPPVV